MYAAKIRVLYYITAIRSKWKTLDVEKFLSISSFFLSYNIYDNQQKGKSLDFVKVLGNVVINISLME
jgi:hypothetical protein